MPLIITDEMVKKECMMSRPIPVQALGVLLPKRVGNKPNYIRKRGRSGIRPVELPVYAPASVGSLVKSICDISKLDEQVVEKYLELGINNQLAQYKKVGDFSMDTPPAAEQVAVEFDGGSAADEPVELFDVEPQTRASYLADTKPKRKGVYEDGDVMYADPSRFISSEGDIAPATDNSEIGTGNLDVRNPNAVQGGVVGSPATLRGSSRRADGEPEL